MLFRAISDAPDIEFGTRGVIPDRPQQKSALSAQYVPCEYLYPQKGQTITVITKSSKLHTTRAEYFVPIRKSNDAKHTSTAGSNEQIKSDNPAKPSKRNDYTKPMSIRVLRD